MKRQLSPEDQASLNKLPSLDIKTVCIVLFTPIIAGFVVSIVVAFAILWASRDTNPKIVSCEVSKTSNHPIKMSHIHRG